MRLNRGAARALRPVAWGCVVLLGVLSLLPAKEMIRTGLDGHIEHAMAYAGTAFLLGLNYPAWKLKWIAAALVIYAGVLELLQNFSPGRHAAILDWAASSAGVVAGAVFVYVADDIWRRYRIGWSE